MALLGPIAVFSGPGPEYNGPIGQATEGRVTMCDGSVRTWAPKWHTEHRWDIYEGEKERWEEITDEAGTASHWIQQVGWAKTPDGRDVIRFECARCGEKQDDIIAAALSKTYPDSFDPLSQGHGSYFRGRMPR